MARYIREHAHRWPYTLAEQPYDVAYFALPVQMVPVILEALETIAIASRYGDGLPNFEGLDAIRSTQYMLLNAINEPINRIYRLLDTSINGVTYENTGTEENPVISPDIPIVPAATTAALIPTIKDIQALISSGILGSSEVASYTPAESIVALLTRIADGETEWTEEDIANALQLLEAIALAL